ncbi:proteasome A-type and B-ATP-dependent protease [Cryptosporidium andersoni]|uniref:Proteasome A-type and B-ATP-dependent protease n=1 Tax=Cryptosporidium andersoni TaxID=117008 RepID=A0A1J4MVW8_9CRYT|nr:proteasome A-type and B-ATP-dependent protease [Cryptosporidium andersoni]
MQIFFKDFLKYNLVCGFSKKCRLYHQSRFERQAWHSTTILSVRTKNSLVMIGDGQVSQGNLVVKPNARKIRKIGNIVLGFSGATADCFTLVERLESKLDNYSGQLTRACVELARSWRTEKYLRHLQAVIIAADKNVTLQLTGNGDVLESYDNIMAIGSGGPYAAAAARALVYSNLELDALYIATSAMKIAADMCVMTNHNFVIEEISR